MKEGNQTFSSKDVVEGLVELLNAKEYKKSSLSPRFTIQEISFLADIIFNKPYENIPLAFVEYIEKSFMMGVRLTSPMTYRRIQFYKHLVLTRGNAKKAAISAGYSPVGAKQQAYRILKNFGKGLR